MKTIIKWIVGDGNIVAEYNGDLNGEIKIYSDIINEGVDRKLAIYVKTINRNKQHSLLINLIGKREEFHTLNGEFITADEQTFNVLKHGIQ